MERPGTLLAILVVTLAGAYAVDVAVAALPTDPGDLLEVLQARDSQFDNAKLEYISRSVSKDEGFGLSHRGPLKNLPPQAKRPHAIPVIYHESLTVRGGNATFTRELDESLLPKEAGPGHVLPTVYQKWSNTEGKQREITQLPRHRPERELILEILPSFPEGDVAPEQRFAIEFAHGFGFGKRIQRISAVTPQGDDLLIEGTMRLWTEDQSTFKVRLDKDLIVREAAIDAAVGHAMNRVEAKTSGMVDQGNFQFAAKGSFSRTLWGWSDGKKIGAGKVLKQFDTEFKRVTFALDDKQYAQLTDMSVPDGTTVFDRIAGINYKKGKLPDFSRRIAAIGGGDTEVAPGPVKPATAPRAAVPAVGTAANLPTPSLRQRIMSTQARPYLVVTLIATIVR